jgi:hypothetical protein
MLEVYGHCITLWEPSLQYVCRRATTFSVVRISFSLMESAVYFVSLFFFYLLRPTISRPVRPDARHPSGPRDQFVKKIFLDSCGFVDVGHPLSDERTGL